MAGWCNVFLGGENKVMKHGGLKVKAVTVKVPILFIKTIIVFYKRN